MGEDLNRAISPISIEDDDRVSGKNEASVDSGTAQTDNGTLFHSSVDIHSHRADTVNMPPRRCIEKLDESCFDVRD